MIEQSLQEILDTQNENIERLANRMVESAMLFQNEHDMRYLFDFLIQLDATLSENGVFLRDILDRLEDSQRE